MAVDGMRKHSWARSGWMLTTLWRNAPPEYYYIICACQQFGEATLLFFVISLLPAPLFFLPTFLSTVHSKIVFSTVAPSDYFIKVEIFCNSQLSYC